MGPALVRKPLTENPGHLLHLCSRLDIGVPGRELCRVYGGYHHRMWQLETDRGRYAIKQLAPDVDIGNPDSVSHYNLTESIAEAFVGRGIPAIHALERRGEHLQIIEDIGYLVYPWTDAVALGRHEIAEKHVFHVARILAKMHCADVAFPQLEDTKFDFHPEEKMKALVSRAVACNVRNASILSDQLPSFMRIVKAQRDAINVMEKRVVVSHGDADHRNVLWSPSGEPILIDWESARRLSPTYEIIVQALDWSGITSTFQHDLFAKMIAAYRKAGGVIEVDPQRASFDCILGDWLNWLMFNVGRSLNLEDAEERELGTGQVDLALATILRLQRLLPNLRSAVDS